jgi:uncharacterized protein with HEPN domain
MPHDDSVFLHHMLDAIATIESYISDLDHATFLDHGLI